MTKKDTESFTNTNITNTSQLSSVSVTNTVDTNISSVNSRKSNLDKEFTRTEAKITDNKKEIQLSVEALVKKLNETQDSNIKINTILKIIKQINSPSLNGPVLDSLIKGLVSSLHENSNNGALFEKIMALLEKLIVSKNDKILTYLNILIPTMLE